MAVSGVRRAAPATSGRVGPARLAAPVGAWQRPRFPSRGWRLPIALAVLVALLIEGAYLLAERNAAGRGVFIGQIWAPHDVAQYLAAMGDGARGSLLIHDRLTSEPHDPALIYPFYVALGWLGHLVGLDSAAGYRLAGLVGRAFALLSIYGATALVSPAPWRRQLAFVLAAFGGGLLTVLGLLQFLAGTDVALTGRDLEEPEFGTFLLLFASPHLMFGLGLLLLTVLAYVRAWRAGPDGWRPAAVAAGLSVALSLVNSYSLGTLCAAVAVHAAVMCALARRVIWRGVVAALAVEIAALPVLIYGVLTFVLGADPFWGVAYGRQNLTPTPAPLNVAIAFGLLLALALAGARAFARHLTVGRVLLLAWIVTSVALMYLPVGVQRRFAFGLQPMLALVAAFGLPPLWRAVARRRPLPWSLLRLPAMLLLFQALFGSAALLSAVAVTRANDAAAYTQRDDRSDLFPAAVDGAGRWLAEQIGPEAIVLAQPATGNALARTIPGRVYVGHWSATVAFSEKRDRVRWLFAGPPDDERRAFLAGERIDVVVVAPNERPHTWWTTADDGAARAAGLARVYAGDGAVIYRVSTQVATPAGPTP